MEKNELTKLETVDFSQFKWGAYIPGEMKIDDLALLLFQGDITKLAIPEHFAPATYTLHFVKSGSMWVNINNREYEIKQYGGYFVSPDFLLSHPSKSSYTEVYTLAFSPKFAQELNLPFSLAQMAYIYIHPTWQMNERKAQRTFQYLELLRNVIDDKNREAAVQLVNSLILYLAGNYINDQPRLPQLSREEEITGKFLALVDANCEQQHALDWYASELCLSTRYVANTVKQTLGMTASSCIERALMQRAKAILSTSTTPIAEIAEKLGFQNQSHFGTFFKRHEGCSPKDFRTQKYK